MAGAPRSSRVGAARGRIASSGMRAISSRTSTSCSRRNSPKTPRAPPSARIALLISPDGVWVKAPRAMSKSPCSLISWFIFLRCRFFARNRAARAYCAPVPETLVFDLEEARESTDAPRWNVDVLD